MSSSYMTRERSASTLFKRDMAKTKEIQESIINKMLGKSLRDKRVLVVNESDLLSESGRILTDLEPEELVYAQKGSTSGQQHDIVFSVFDEKSAQLAEYYQSMYDLVQENGGIFAGVMISSEATSDQDTLSWPDPLHETYAKQVGFTQVEWIKPCMSQDSSDDHDDQILNSLTFFKFQK